MKCINSVSDMTYRKLKLVKLQICKHDLLIVFQYMVIGANGRFGARVVSRAVSGSRGGIEVAPSHSLDLSAIRVSAILTRTECVFCIRAQVNTNDT